jgi:alpha-beta hydrolase superfamily lysophospholipase
MRRKRRFFVAGALFAGYLALCCAAGVFVAEGTLHPGRKMLAAADLERAWEMARRQDSAIKEVAIEAADGVKLQAWSLRPRSANGNAVILLHGLGDNRMGMIGYAEMLLNHGLSVLMPDARAHGTSGGVMATFGLLESTDIQRWVDWLRDDQHPSCLFGFGESMGAGLLLESLARESRFCAVAAESPFSSFREIAYDRMGQFFHTGPWLGRTILRPVVEVAFRYSRWKYGFDFEQVSPDRAVRVSNVPVLLIHGQVDSNIPVRHSRRIAFEDPRVTLWEVPGADHCGAIVAARDEFEVRLVGWFVGHERAGPGQNAGKIAQAITEMLLPSKRAACHCNEIHDPRFCILQTIECARGSIFPV